jgi:hypothetical protein
VSIPPGEDWTETVKSLLAGCGLKYNEDVSHPELVDQCIDRSETTCDQVLHELFPTHVAKSRPATGYLLRLPFKAVLTTNFDPWIRLHSREGYFTKLHIYPALSLTEGLKGHLYYLHGYFDDGPASSIRHLVFGERSFQAAYDSSSLLSGFLLQVFTYENVLFVGFDPTERRIAEILRMSQPLRQRIADLTRSSLGEPMLPQRLALWKAPEAKEPVAQATEDAKISQLKTLGVEPVLYRREQADHRGLERLLAGWLEAVPDERPAPFATGFTVQGPPGGSTEPAP